MKDLTQEQVDKICRANAIRMLHLDLSPECTETK